MKDYALIAADLLTDLSAALLSAADKIYAETQTRAIAAENDAAATAAAAEGTQATVTDVNDSGAVAAEVTPISAEVAAAAAAEIETAAVKAVESGTINDFDNKLARAMEILRGSK